MKTRFYNTSSTLSSFEGMKNFSCKKQKRHYNKIVSNKWSGNNGEKVTPVPIPNTEVKLLSADGSWNFVPVRVGRCQAVIILFRSSSVVELSAVNRSVVGSSPTCGAIFMESCPSGRRSTIGNRVGG